MHLCWSTTLFARVEFSENT